MIRSRRAGRGWSLVDVAVAFTLLAFAFIGIAKFIVTLADGSETAVTRAAARREVNLARELVTADLAALTPCGPGAAATQFGGFGVDSSGGADSMSVYVDVDLDGDADLIGWRVSGTTLQRTVVLNSGVDCANLDVTGGDWDTVLDSVDRVGGSPYFSVLRDGAPAVLAGSCVDAASQPCDVDAVKVLLTTEIGNSSGPVRFETVADVAPIGGA